MEYHNSKDSTVAGKIFGLGLKLFADDAAYVSHYLDYLMQMNDDNSKYYFHDDAVALISS